MRFNLSRIRPSYWSRCKSGEILIKKLKTPCYSYQLTAKSQDTCNEKRVLMSKSSSKVLVVDGMFPNKYSSWRNYEIIALIEKFGADVFVYKGTPWAGIDFQIDYEFIAHLVDLSEYKFIIFDSAYNYLQSFNKDFDGTKFNGDYPGTYLLTKSNDFDLEAYNVIYHIFLGTIARFNQDFKIRRPKQVCHLYPGGGFGFKSIEKLSDEYTYVSTHPLTSEKCAADGVKFIEAFVTPQSGINEVVRIKPRGKDREFTVCFSSLGYMKEKGARKYVAIGILYKMFFPWHKIRFLAIGNCYKLFPIKVLEPMDFKALENFYFNEVDIQVNLMSKVATNGWPLGIEAVKQGVVLITTDPNQVSKRYIYGENIQISERIWDFILRIRKMYLDREELLSWQEKGLVFFNYHCSFDQQQGRVIQLIEDITNT